MHLKVRFFEQWARNASALATSVRVLWVRFRAPHFRPKSVKMTTLYKKPTSLDMQALKLHIRTAYKGRVPGYIHDVVIHGGDNREHAQHVERIIGRPCGSFLRGSTFCAHALFDAPRELVRRNLAALGVLRAAAPK